MASAPSKSQFCRFLEAAQGQERSHLQQVFVARFVTVVRARDRTGEPCRPESSNGEEEPHDVVAACKARARAGAGRGSEIAFACDGCGSPSVALPEVFYEVSEVRCGACGKWLMTWKDFKAICEERAAQLKREEMSAGTGK